MRELKKTAYNDMTATVIASRDQLCIHPNLKGKSNTDKILMCKSMMDTSDGTVTSTCKFYRNNGPELGTITDIEDLGSYGQTHKCCPYYATKQKSIKSDIIFIPYSYLIDPTLRKANDIDLENTIVILDEAHNVSRVCEDSASSSMKNSDIRAAIKDLNAVSIFFLHFCSCFVLKFIYWPWNF